MSTSGYTREVRVQTSPNPALWMIGVLGAGYWLCALVFNEATLQWFFEEPLALSSDGRFALLALDATLILLGTVSITRRRAEGVVLLNMVIVSVVLSVASVEFALRLREVSDSEILVAEVALRQQDDFLHHSLRPNTETISKWGGEIVSYSTNNLGFRDLRVREVAKSPRSGDRLLILGDSFSEALGVEYEDGFPHRLQGLLSEDGTRMEVLTGAVASHSPRLEFRRLLQFIAGGYQTDALVLMVDISDVHDEGSVYFDWTGYTEEDRRANRIKQQARIAKARQLEAMPASILSPRLLGRIRNVEPQIPLYQTSPRLRWTEEDDIREKPWVDVGLEICSVFVERIADLAKKEGIDFRLGIFPHPTQIAGERCLDSEYRQFYRDLADQQNIELIDLFPDFCELEDWPEFFIAGDIHWNARGHQLVASRLAEHLRAN